MRVLPILLISQRLKLKPGDGEVYLISSQLVTVQRQHLHTTNAVDDKNLSLGQMERPVPHHHHVSILTLLKESWAPVNICLDPKKRGLPWRVHIPPRKPALHFLPARDQNRKTRLEERQIHFPLCFKSHQTVLVLSLKKLLCVFIC